MKKICPECHQKFEGGKFCPECGAKLIDAELKLVCPNCNIVVEKGKFCPECGSKLVERLDLPDNSVSSDQSNPIQCPVCGFPNETGAVVCSACGYPLVENSSNDCDKKEYNISPEDEAILAKYMDNDGDLVEIVEQEVEDSAFEELGSLAKKGIPEAEFLLAGLYFSSKYREQDWNKSYEIMSRAAEKGNKLAYSVLGVYYALGINVEQDIDEGIRRLSLSGDSALTLGILGDIYKDVKGDYKKAFECYTKLAKKNKKEGFTGLGSLYANGLGVTQDYKKAFDYYNQAAALGDFNAEYEIGKMYSLGNGTSVDYDQALYWFNEAAEHGCTVANNSMAYMYLDGVGVEQDKEKAIEMFKASAKCGNVEAMTEVGNYYKYVIFDDKKAVAWYKKAIDLLPTAPACGEAYYELGNCYKSGLGVPQDEKKAEEYYQMAQDAGYEIPESNFDEDGYSNDMEITNVDDEIDKANEELQKGNFKEAVKVYEKYADEGNARAMGNLGMRYILGEGVKKNLKTGLSWLEKAADGGSWWACCMIVETYIDICNEESVKTTVKEKLDFIEKVNFYLSRAKELGAPAEDVSTFEDLLTPKVEMTDVKIKKDVVRDNTPGIEVTLNLHINGMLGQTLYFSALTVNKYQDEEFLNSPMNLNSGLTMLYSRQFKEELIPIYFSSKWDSYKFFIPYRGILDIETSFDETLYMMVWQQSGNYSTKTLFTIEKPFRITCKTHIFRANEYSFELLKTKWK